MLNIKLATVLAARLMKLLEPGLARVELRGELRRAADRLAGGGDAGATGLPAVELLLLPLREIAAGYGDLAAFDHYLGEMAARPDLSPFIRLGTPRAYDQRRLIVTLPQHGEVICDLFTVPATDEWTTALLYQTGSPAFVEGLERKAARLGLELQDNGLFRGDHSLLLHDEADLFRWLKTPYRRPGERD